MLQAIELVPKFARFGRQRIPGIQTDFRVTHPSPSFKRKGDIRDDIRTASGKTEASRYFVMILAQVELASARP